MYKHHPYRIRACCVLCGSYVPASLLDIIDRVRTFADVRLSLRTLESVDQWLDGYLSTNEMLCSDCITVAFAINLITVTDVVPSFAITIVRVL